MKVLSNLYTGERMVKSGEQTDAVSYEHTGERTCERTDKVISGICTNRRIDGRTGRDAMVRDGWLEPRSRQVQLSAAFCIFSSVRARTSVSRSTSVCFRVTVCPCECFLFACHEYLSRPSFIHHLSSPPLPSGRLLLSNGR